jgi:glycosyltransferase involved in cell wall biosynthesis
MRVLWCGIKAPEPPGPVALESTELEVSCLSAARVDCGDFGYSEPRAEDYDCPIDLLPVFPRRPYPYSLYLRGLSRALQGTDPEVIYIVGEPSELGVAQLVAAARRTVPEARTVLQSFENVHRDWSGFPRMLRGRAERDTLPRLDMIRAISDSARRVLVERGYPKERIRVVPLSADPERFYPREVPALREKLVPDGRFLIGYVGRLVEEKGVDVLLRAVSEMDRDAVLCIVGSGRAADDLQALGRELPNLSVRWIERVPHDEVADYMAAFDAMVLPSRSIPNWREQFGMVLAEAMACGTPLIGSTCGAIPEVIGNAGLTFPEEDHRALAEALDGLAGDPAEVRRLSDRALARFRDHYHPQVELRQLVCCFQEALQRPQMERE